MSALFISHSSADNAPADELKALLSAHGHRSVFLDFDPEVGIAAGRHWEQELYAQLRACQAVVVLCSARSMASAWCLAEITHARALGKPILPLKVDDCSVWSLLNELQVIDFTRDREQGLQRLLHGLAAHGLDARNLFDWDASRPPYPGLLAFQKADAAVYFGRAAAVQATLETLDRLRRLGGPRLVLVLGASGSGKSSLVRAGVLPRIERDAGSWVVAPPFRPLSRPLDSMALALAGTPGAADWKAVRAALATEPVGAPPWRDLVNELRRRAGPEASVLVTVDQFEEALDGGPNAGDEKTAFLRLLRSIADERDGALFVIATLRSDFLGAFQTDPVLRGVAYEPIHLAQIDRADMAQVIEGPAQVAGLRLEEGLAKAMVDDTATDDALPLLAFALRELHDRFGAELRRGGELTIDQYRVQLGGLQGALARAAEALCQDGAGADLDALRRALLELVRVDHEGRYVRQPRRWSDLPAAAQPPLERFVQARLLVSSGDDRGQRWLEVAHEALFRSWDRLAGWLAADRDFLLWRARLDAACQTWVDNGRDASLVLRGPLLAEAQRWQAERADGLQEAAREFIGASIAVRDAAAAARERTRRRLLAALAGAVVVFGTLAAAAGWQWREANQERSLAVARELGARADVAWGNHDPVLGLLLTLHSLQSAWTPDAHNALVQRIDSIATPQPSSWKPHPGPIRALALSPDRRWLATAGPGHLQVQARDGEVRDLQSRNGHAYLHALAFSADGRWLAAACEEPTVCLYDTTQWTVTRLPKGGSALTALAFGRGDTLLASISRGVKGVRLFEMPGAKELAPLDTGDDPPEGLALSRDGRWLAVSKRGWIEIWDPLAHKRLAQQGSPGPKALAFSQDQRLLATSGAVIFDLGQKADGQVELAPRSAGGGPSGNPFAVVAFSADARYVATSTSAQGALITGFGPEPVTSLAPGSAGALQFADGRRLVVGELDGRISEWDPDARALRRVPHAGKVHAVALSADGRRLATASADGMLRLIDTGNGNEIGHLSLPCDPGGLAFSADGRWLSVVEGEKLRLAETAGLRIVGPFVHEARVTAVRFEDGGRRVATATLWDGDIRYQVRRPTRLRVWDIESRQELGWRFDLEGDRKRVKSIAAKASLDGVSSAAGGDAALVSASAAWPEAYATDDLNFLPRLLVPGQLWLSTKTTAGTPLVDAALHRAELADSIDEAEHRYAISADGRLLASNAGAEARLWPLRFVELELQACQRLPRNLTCAEWREAQGDTRYRKACEKLPDPPDAADCQAGARR
jgi:WD40 repeat protein